MSILCRRQFLRLATGAAALPALSRLANAQAYPARPIRLVIPYAAGGVTDVIGRQWAERVGRHLGTIVVENQAGGGGAIATGAVARAQPDGYTLLIANSANMVINPLTTKVPYDPFKDFAPVAILTYSVFGVVVHPSVPAKTLSELVTYAKANAGKLSYGASGIGGMAHLSGELFKQLIGAPEITLVPYRGGGPNMTDLISGHIPLAMIAISGQVLELHRAGKVRILAVTSQERLKGVPDMPTAAEQGLPGMIVQQFNGLFAPIKTPRPIVDQIHQASQKAMTDPAMQKVLIESGVEPVTNSSPDNVAALMQEEILRWGPVVKAAGLKAE